MYFPTDYSSKSMSLVTAAAKGDVDLVRSLLDEGTDVHYETDLALRGAAFTGNLATLRLLIERGADIHANNDEALLYAGKRRDIEMTEFLIGRGADVQAVFKNHAADVDESFVETLDSIHSLKLTEEFQKKTEILKSAPPSGKFKFRKTF